MCTASAGTGVSYGPKGGLVAAQGSRPCHGEVGREFTGCVGVSSQDAGEVWAVWVAPATGASAAETAETAARRHAPAAAPTAAASTAAKRNAADATPSVRVDQRRDWVVARAGRHTARG